MKKLIDNYRLFLMLIGLPLGSVGYIYIYIYIYIYEENRCRAIEDASSSDLMKAYDWSYDKTNKYQGKNW